MKPVEQSKRQKNVAYEVSETPASHSGFSSQGDLQDSAEEGNLEKVRDILFGTQSREFDERCNRLEKRLLQESTDLKDQFTRSLDEVKTYVNSEITRLTNQIQQEQAGRSNSLEEVGQVMKTMGTQLENRLSGLHDQTATQHQKLEGQLTQQKAELSEQHQQALDDMQARFQEALNELKTDKTDRAVLAEMLMDVALRLKVGQKDTEQS